MDVAYENVAAIFLGKLSSLVNADHEIRSHVMLVIHNGGQQFIRVRISWCSALANINSTRCHMEEMVNDTCADECISVSIKIHTPRIAGAISENFEFLCVGLIACNRGSDF